MPKNTVYVGRPTKWGNPFVIGEDNPRLPGRKVVDQRHAFNLYRAEAPMNDALVKAARAELRGKNLACWCEVHPYPTDGECHADILLQLANSDDSTGEVTK
jgi:hypothetical protein